MTKFKNKYILLIVIVLLVVGVAYLLFDNKQNVNITNNLDNSTPVLNNDISNNLTINENNKVMTAIIKTTKGDIEIKLYADLVPNTVNNFVKLVKEGFYDGVYFHRVIPDFMIQTGDPQAKGTPGKDFVYAPDGSSLRVTGLYHKIWYHSM